MVEGILLCFGHILLHLNLLLDFGNLISHVPHSVTLHFLTHLQCPLGSLGVPLSHHLGYAQLGLSLVHHLESTRNLVSILHVLLLYYSVVLARRVMRVSLLIDI